jgi:hypothetical protein
LLRSRESIHSLKRIRVRVRVWSTPLFKDYTLWSLHFNF